MNLVAANSLMDRESPVHLAVIDSMRFFDTSYANSDRDECTK